MSTIPDGGPPDASPDLPHLAETITLDGVPGVPLYVAEALGGTPPLPWRWPAHGKVLACGPVDFPAPYGRRLVVFSEGGAVAYYPEETPGKVVQKVLWWDLPRVAKALGIA